MSEEIHFLEDGYYVDKLEKEIQQLKEVIAIKEKQLEEVKNNKTDYTKVNILEMKLDKYKEVIDQIREYIKNSSDMSVVNNYSFPDKPVIDKRSKKDLLQILDKVKNV